MRTRQPRRRSAALAVAALSLLIGGRALAQTHASGPAQSDGGSEAPVRAAPPPSLSPPRPSPPDAARWVLPVQSTLVDQGTLRFHSPFRGPNSLDPGMRGRETFDASLWGGLRLWQGSEV